jgi:hypothetical protein
VIGVQRDAVLSKLILVDVYQYTFIWHECNLSFLIVSLFITIYSFFLLLDEFCLEMSRNTVMTIIIVLFIINNDLLVNGVHCNICDLFWESEILFVDNRCLNFSR